MSATVARQGAQQGCGFVPNPLPGMSTELETVS
jgi:hypothetical protein